MFFKVYWKFGKFFLDSIYVFIYLKICIKYKIFFKENYNKIGVIFVVLDIILYRG